MCIVVQALGAGRRESKEDWMEWLRRLSIELLKESPSPALRSCWALAQAYNALARSDNTNFKMTNSHLLLFDHTGFNC